MVHPNKVARNFIAVREYTDIEGTPVREDHIEIYKDNVLPFLKKLYPGTRISVEPMGEGLAYYGSFSVGGRRMIGNYSFEKKELWYKIYPGTNKPYKPSFQRR